MDADGPGTRAGATTTAAGEGGRRRARDESRRDDDGTRGGAERARDESMNLSTCGGTGLPPKKVKNKSIGNGFIFSLKINPSERIYFGIQKVK